MRDVFITFADHLSLRVPCRIAIPNAMMVILTYLIFIFPAQAEIAVLRRDCDRLVKYQQRSGVEYQAGINSHGQPVVPADIGGGYQIKLPETIFVPIESLAIQDHFKLPPDSVLWSAKAQLGMVTVKGDQVYYEGQLLGDEETAALEEFCRKHISAQ